MGSIISFLILFFITMIIIKILPQLLGIVVIIWVISTIVRVIQEVRRPRGSSRDFYGSQSSHTDQSYSDNHNGDVIDVEYTTRDVTDQENK
ncbi:MULTISPECIES: hypothetical protein [Erysipelothrix]|uniref:DUF4834 family protein n=1 Tax=Erysipelothrix piscisicarius TaxID=2485784 RepID=A0A3S5HK62_9FIRM|nr:MULTISPECIES: hypothetical protein [Erysipelothrix]AZK43809.1 hypothetical protein EEI45_02500 [Erysipelothrix piscisicarius]MBK2402067.1 hypothetical protein [Erysipelothrix sp. strain 2 (EsS2-6-Brazil)]MBK2403817.1 hypothetical protein [Erysipelothrix sp. strain 2 (EsS2-7-Brazil)]NBA01090.1 hypothetical protein [Erysipelothrix rhusiopathiae]